MPPSTPQPIAAAPVAPTPVVNKADDEKGGERVIQPLHDTSSEEEREEMSRQMDELLGNIPVEQSRPTETEEASATTEEVDPNAIQPGYEQNLASDLSRDMQDQNADPSSMAARMSADLKDDPLTQQAQAMPVQPANTESPNDTLEVAHNGTTE
jgi:hypothetical protein